MEPSPLVARWLQRAAMLGMARAYWRAPLPAQPVSLAARTIARCVAAPRLRPSGPGAGGASGLELPDRRRGATAAAAAGARHGAGTERPRRRGSGLGRRAAYACAQRTATPQAEAAADLVQALIAHNAAPARRGGVAGARHARRPAAVLPAAARRGHSRQRSSAGSIRPACRSAGQACEHRAAWHALAAAAAATASHRRLGRCQRQTRAARDLAAWAGDDFRSGHEHRRSGLADGTQRKPRRRAAAAAAGTAAGAALPAIPMLLARIRLAEAQIAAQRGEHDSVRRLAEEALAAGPTRRFATAGSQRADLPERCLCQARPRPPTRCARPNADCRSCAATGSAHRAGAEPTTPGWRRSA